MSIQLESDNVTTFEPMREVREQIQIRVYIETQLRMDRYRLDCKEKTGTKPRYADLMERAWAAFEKSLENQDAA